jgi:threonine/homoserine/homoserine lactone efflux protein
VGLIITVGVALDLFVHTTAVALGVAVIFKTSQYAFSTLKYAGAAYLLYLAWQANPKITIFFLAFLPQFVFQEMDQL